MTAPSSRVRPGFVVAVAVAVVLFVGIVGLVGVALFGGGNEPTGDGLGRQVEVGQPATAPQRFDAEATDSDSVIESGDPTVGSNLAVVGDAPPTTSAPTPVTTVQAVTEIETPAAGQSLPAPGSAAVEFPVLVTIPPPPSTYPAIPVAELDADGVPELAGWAVASRDDDHLALEHGNQVVDIFVVDRSSAGDALAWFYDRVDGHVADVADSPPVRLGAPSSRFVSVAGSQFVATDTGHQGTTTISGSALAAAGAGGAAVIAVSRPGTSSAEELSADGELLRAILAHL